MFTCELRKMVDGTVDGTYIVTREMRTHNMPLHPPHPPRQMSRSKIDRCMNHSDSVRTGMYGTTIRAVVLGER